MIGAGVTREWPSSAKYPVFGKKFNIALVKILGQFSHNIKMELDKRAARSRVPKIARTLGSDLALASAEMT